MWQKLVAWLLFVQASYHVFASEEVSSSVGCRIGKSPAAVDACAIKASLRTSRAFSQILPFINPSAALYVSYGNSVVGKSKQLSLAQARYQPQLSLHLAKLSERNRLISREYSVLCLASQPHGMVRMVWFQSGLQLNPQTGGLSWSLKPLKRYALPDQPTDEYIFLVSSSFEPMLAWASNFSGAFDQLSTLNQLGELDEIRALDLTAKEMNTFLNTSFKLPALMALFSRFQVTVIAASYFRFQGASQATVPHKIVHRSTHEHSIVRRPPVGPHFAVPSVQLPRVDVCGITSDAAGDACKMISAFGGSSITPKILSKFIPLGALYVQYNNLVVGGAQQLAPYKVQKPPQIRFTSGVSNYNPTGRTYFLLLVDTSVKSPIVSVSWAQSGVKIDPHNGTLLPPPARFEYCHYIAPNPVEPNQAHNYILLLFEQPNGFSLPVQYSNLFRSIHSNNHQHVKIDINSFIANTGLNTPVAGSFFKSSKATHA